MIQPASIFTKRLTPAFAQVPPGRTITDETLSEVAGIDVTSPEGRQFVYTAIKRVERFHGFRFERERGIGYTHVTRTNATASVLSGPGARIRRAARRAVTTLERTATDLKGSARNERDAAISSFREANAAVRAPRRDKIAAEVANRRRALTPTETRKINTRKINN